jgi:hypothetical protein
MVNFPPLTPSDFRWEAPTYEQVSHTAEDGAIVRQILMDTPGQGRVQVEFQNCRDSDFEAVLAAHDAAYGQWDALALPAAFWSGRGAALRTVIDGYDARLEWAFAEVPAADWEKKGRCTIKVTLKHRVRPLALTLTPGGMAIPLLPKVDPGAPAVVDALPVLNCNIVVTIPPLVGCQTFWTSRLLESIYPNSIPPIGSQLVDVAGNNYTVFDQMPVGAADTDSVGLVLVKRDVGGAVIWVRATPLIVNRQGGGRVAASLLFAGADVIVTTTTSPAEYTLYRHFWRITAAGAQVYHKVTGGVRVGFSDAHFTFDEFKGIYDAASGEVLMSRQFVAFGDYGAELHRYNAATGAWIGGRRWYVNCLNQAAPAVAGDGSIVITGHFSNTPVIRITNPNTLEITAEYRYLNGGTGFTDIVSYDANSWLVVGRASDDYFLVSKATYDIVAWYKSSLGSALKSTTAPLTLIVESTGVVTFVLEGDNTLWQIDIPNQKIRTVQYEFAWELTTGNWVVPTPFSRFRGPVLDMTANLLLCNINSIYRPLADLDDRVLTIGVGLELPPGTHYIDAHPPTNRRVRVVVNRATGQLVLQANPTTVVATPTTAFDPTPALPSPTVTGHDFADTQAFTFNTQTALVCPPAFDAAITGPATAIQGTAQQYTAAIIPDPALTAWPYAYSWSSPNAVFSDSTIAQPLVTWTGGAGANRVLTVIVSNAGHTKTATLTVAITAP